MKYLVLLVIGMAANSFVSEAGFFDTKREEDPVTLLSKALSRLTEAEDLATNIKLANEHNWKSEPEASQANFMKAVDAFKKFNVDETCDPNNAHSSALLKGMAGPDNVQFLFTNPWEQLRVFRFMSVIKDDVENECFVRLEQKWNDDPERTKRLNEKFPELIQVSDLLASYEPPRAFRRISDIRELNGALQILKYQHVKKYRLKGDGVKSVLKAIHLLKNKEESLKSISKAKAAQLIDEYLVKPCEELREQPELEIFLSVVYWGIFAQVTDLVKGDIWTSHPDWESLHWSARWAFCEALLTKVDRKKLASKVAWSRV